MRGFEAVQRLTRWRWFPFVGLVSVALAFAVLAVTLVPDSLAGGDSTEDDFDAAVGTRSVDPVMSTAAKARTSRSTSGRSVRSPTSVRRRTQDSPGEESDTEPLDDEGDELEEDEQ
jgi:hypothetical protein